MLRGSVLRDTLAGVETAHTGCRDELAPLVRVLTEVVQRQPRSVDDVHQADIHHGCVGLRWRAIFALFDRLVEILEVADAL